MEKDKKLWIGIFITFLFVIIILISYGYYKKFQDAKYAYNRNCYYRIDSVLNKTEHMINELQKISKSSKVSKESILKLKYLESSISTEVVYLNLEVNDFKWKISKVKDYYSASGFYGRVIDAYFNYIEKTYEDESFLDLKKEADALNYILLYYKDMKNVILEGADYRDYEEKYKADITRGDSWIGIVSRLNIFDQEFNEENRDKILENLK